MTPPTHSPMRSRFVQSANTCSGGAATCVVMVYRATVVTYSASDGGPMTPEDLAVRNATYRLFADVGRAPTHDEVAVATGQTSDAVDAAWHRLQADHALVLDGDGRLLMANPFSAVATPHRVEAAGRSWYANCGWDAFGIGVVLRTQIRRSTPNAPTAAKRSISRCATIAQATRVRSSMSLCRRATGGATSASLERPCSSSGRRTTYRDGWPAAVPAPPSR